MVPKESLAMKRNEAYSGDQPTPCEQFECECTHFMEQISNVLIFPPAVSSSFCELLYRVSKKYHLVNHRWANKVESSETSISKQCLIWGSSSVDLSQVSVSLSAVKLLFDSFNQTDHTQLEEAKAGTL